MVKKSIKGGNCLFCIKNLTNSINLILNGQFQSFQSSKMAFRAYFSHFIALNLSIYVSNRIDIRFNILNLPNLFYRASVINFYYPFKTVHAIYWYPQEPGPSAKSRASNCYLTIAQFFQHRNITSVSCLLSIGETHFYAVDVIHKMKIWRSDLDHLNSICGQRVCQYGVLHSQTYDAKCSIQGLTAFQLNASVGVA